MPTFTASAVIKRNRSFTRTLNAVINYGFTANAVISARTFDRHRHQRAELHFGVLTADLVEISTPVYGLPAGTTLQEVLRVLWDRTTYLEVGVYSFSVNAVIT